MAELAARQRNVLPFDSIRNGALLDAILLRQSYKLKPWQRAGAIVYGFLGLVVCSCYIGIWLVPGLRNGDFSQLAPLAAMLLCIYVGIRIVVNAVFPSQPSRDEERQ